MAENSVVAFFEPNLFRKEAVLELMAQNKPIIKVSVKLPGSKIYIAQGPSKKDAEQNEALLCLDNNL